MTGTSWFDPLQATISDYTDAARRLGEGAGAGLLDHLSGALARLQALPEEASAAVAEMHDALAALFPDPSVPPVLIPAEAATSDAPCPTGSGQDGTIARTDRLDRAGLPRRWQVDSAGLARYLRAQHPVKPAEHAAARTGIPVDTVAKILGRESLPVGRTLLAFIVAYGPELLAAVLPGAEARWLEGARILADQARLEAELVRTRAAMAANAGRWRFCGIEFGAAP